MQLCFYLIKLSQNIFVGRKYKKKNTIQKTPSTIQKKLSFVDVFSEKIYKLFYAKEKSSPYRQGLSISFYNLDI